MSAAGKVGPAGQRPGRAQASPAPEVQAPVLSLASPELVERSQGPQAWEPTFQWPVRVYWEDTDAGGIVFYANYLKFFERARTEWLRSLGLAQQRLREEGAGMFVVTHSDLRYLRPARLDDLLLVTARLLEAGRASLTIEQQVVRAPLAGDGDRGAAPSLLCEGRIRVGWVTTDGLRPQRIPAHLLALLAGNG